MPTRRRPSSSSARPAAWLWHYRERVVDEFYAGLSMKMRMLLHVVRRSGSLHDFAAYLTLMGRKFDTSSKKRPVAAL